MIAVDDPGAVSTGAQPIAVMRYEDLRPGQRVPDSHYDDHAFPCWVGTSARRARLQLAVTRTSTTSPSTGQDGEATYAFLDRGRATRGPALETVSGVGLATQETDGLCG